MFSNLYGIKSQLHLVQGTAKFTPLSPRNRHTVVVRQDHKGVCLVPVDFLKKLEIDQIRFVGSEKADIRKLPFYGFEGTCVGTLATVREMNVGIIGICRKHDDLIRYDFTRGTNKNV
jgi:hypothetical protein